jgi:hypothetical protein
MAMDASAAGNLVPHLRAGDAVVVTGRPAFFLYRRGHAAVIRFRGERESRVVPLAKITVVPT